MGKLMGAVLTITIFQILMALFLSDACFEGPGVDSCTFTGSECNANGVTGEVCRETQPGNMTDLCAASSVTCKCYSECSSNTGVTNFIPGNALIRSMTDSLETGVCQPSWCINAVDGSAVNFNGTPSSSECWSVIYGDSGNTFRNVNLNDCSANCVTAGGTYSTNELVCEANDGTWVTDGWYSVMIGLLQAVGVIGIIAGLYVIKSDFAFYVAFAALIASWGSSYWLAYAQIKANLGTIVPEIVILFVFIPVMISWWFIILDWIRGRD